MIITLGKITIHSLYLKLFNTESCYTATTQTATLWLQGDSITARYVLREEERKASWGYTAAPPRSSSPVILIPWLQEWVLIERMSHGKRFAGWGFWETEASYCPSIRMWMEMLWLLLATTCSQRWSRCFRRSSEVEGPWWRSGAGEAIDPFWGLLFPLHLQQWSNGPQCLNEFELGLPALCSLYSCPVDVSYESIFVYRTNTYRPSTLWMELWVSTCSIGSDPFVRPYGIPHQRLSVGTVHSSSEKINLSQFKYLPVEAEYVSS